MDEQLLALINAVYDAAMDPSLWPVALGQVAGFMGAQAATFWVLDGNDSPALTEFSFFNFDPDFIQHYLDYMAMIDPTVQYLVDHPDSPIIHCGQYLTDRDIDHSEYYKWHLRHSDTRYRLLGQISPTPETQAGITLHRTKKSGRFQPSDLKVFKLLYTHLKRSLMITYRLETLGHLNTALGELLNRNHVALALLDRQKQVVHCNRRMEALVREGRTIEIKHSALTLNRHAESGGLARVLTKAGSGVGDFMAIHHEGSEHHYLLFATPIPATRRPFSSGQATICVAVIDPGQDIQMPLERLRHAYALTQAECRLAEFLGSGVDLKTAADRLGIEYGTARARLADIFEKTGTHRQAELVRLIWLMLPAA